MSSPTTKDPQREIAARFVEQIKSGKSFLVNKSEISIPPINPVSGMAFSGINRLILATANEQDPRWTTKSMAEKQGYVVKEGAESQKMIFWEYFQKASIKDEKTGEPVRDDDGKIMTKTIKHERPVMRFFNVYSYKDLSYPDGRDIPGFEDGRNAEYPAARVKALLEESGLEIEENAFGKDGFYNPHKGKLILTDSKSGKVTEDEYNSLIVKALSGYAALMSNQVTADELWRQPPLSVAIAASFANQELGLPSLPFGDGPPDNAVLNRWADQIEKDPYALFRAAADAEKIKDQLLSPKRAVSQIQTREDRQPVKLSVPFAERDEVKKLGAYFLPEEKLWVSSPDNKNLPELTARWPYDPEKHKQILESQEKSPKRTYLDVAFEDKDRAKELGAKFDFRKKQWFVEPEKDLAPFVEWLSEKDRKTLPVMTPEEEFATVLKKAGLVLKESPVMDGKPHKAPVVGQKNGAAQGTYCFVPDISRPSFYMNHLSGVSDSWTYSGQMLSESKKAELTEELGNKKQQIRQEKAIADEKNVQRIMDKFARTTEASNNHPFLAANEIWKNDLRLDADYNLVGVAVNIDQSLKDSQFTPRPQTLFTITPEGRAGIEPGTKAAGAALLIGQDQFDEVGKNPNEEHILLVTPDYETGAYLHESTGKPVAVAFGLQNMQSVGKALRKRLPNTRIAVCVNHDQTPQKVTSLEKGNKIADSIGGLVTVMQPSLTKEQIAHGVTSFHEQAIFIRQREDSPDLPKGNELAKNPGLGR